MNVVKNLAQYIYENTEDNNKTAYYFKNEKITYSSLHIKSRKIAWKMNQLDVYANDRVLFFLNDTPALPFSFLASLQVGAIPVPLNPRAKSLYLQHYMKDSEAKLIICEIENYDNICKALEEANIKAIIIVQNIFSDIDDSHIDKSGKHNTILLSEILQSMELDTYHATNDDVMLWQYTSGTTGMPKAVTHKSAGMLHNNEVYAKGLLNISNEDIIYSTAKMFFGYGLGNSFYFTLLNNASSILDDRWPDENLVLENIKKFKPTYHFSVPNLYSKLLNHHGQILAESIASCKKYISAGSPLPAETFVTWRQRFGVEIIDGIGATEVGHIFLSNIPGSCKPSITGSPLPGYEVKLLQHDSSSRGELMVKGPSVSPGYHNQADKNAKSFVNGWYMTGDIFSKNSNDEYKYVGRKGDIFKYKGRWIVPQNLEEYLLSNFKWIDEVAVLPSDCVEAKPIMCFVKNKNKNDYKNIKEEMLECIKEVFEGHYFPQEYRKLESFPRNENGKVLRNKLLDMSAEIL
ncbi:AMP-binding protein [Agarilytica rhodophyticola]|uniref:AMP-binding protein n=1 Tax=Agarilytica rhodophyticola TaxID=1737490 RepID=UPI000B341B36|nr:AMP-binding protein [Agarilytica rhodophyticola]